MQLTEPFLVAQALSDGATPAVLRNRRRFAAPSRGIRIPSHRASDSIVQTRAVLLASPPGTVVCHVSALDLLGVERPWQYSTDPDTHILVPRGSNPRRPGVVTHTTHARPEVVHLVEGIPVLAPYLVWRQLAGELPVWDLIVLGDAMTRRKHRATSLSMLQATTAATASGTRGIARMRAALPEVREGTDSSQETRARLALREAGFPRPEVNHVIRNNEGQFIAMVDVAFPGQHLAIEYEGDHHRTDRATWRRDISRVRALEDAGWSVLRITADDVRDPLPFLDQVRRRLRSQRPAEVTEDVAVSAKTQHQL
jgi:hypothetical protein